MEVYLRTVDKCTFDLIKAKARKLPCVAFTDRLGERVAARMLNGFKHAMMQNIKTKQRTSG